MTIRLSTGARQGMGMSGGLASLFNRGRIEIYTGSQPASADNAAVGTLIGTVTQASGALTKETRASGTVTITAAAGGTINTITVGGLNIIPDGAITAVVGDTAATAVLLNEAINRNGMMEATVVGSVVTIRGRPGTGVSTAAISGSLTTVTATYVNMGSLVAGVAPVNGLIFTCAAGVLSKVSDQIWSFNALSTNTAGWFRIYSSDSADSGASSTTFARIDGSCAASGGDLNMNIGLVLGGPTTFDTLNITIPA